MGGNPEDTQVHAMGDLLSALAERRGGAYLIVLSGRSAGRLISLQPGDTVIGRGKECDVVLTDRGVSRVHLRLHLDEQGAVSALDMGSTNGTWVEGHRVEYQTLRDGDRLRVGAALLLKLACSQLEEAEFANQLFESAARDALTHLPVPRLFEERLQEELLWHRRHHEPLTLAILEVDRYDRQLEFFGKRDFDSHFKTASVITRGQLRGEDLVARLGAAGLAALLRRTTAEGARVAIARIHTQITSAALPLTLSAGVVSLIPGETSGDVLLGLARERLSRAAARGEGEIEDGEGRRAP